MQCCAVVSVTLILISFIGCKNTGDSEERPIAVSTVDTIPPNSRAFDMLQDGKPFEEYMKVQMEAVEQLRNGHPQSDAINILSQTGHFMMRHGDYTDALEYLHEASDSAENRRKEGRIDASMIRVHSNLASILARFGLMDQALEENAKAFEVSKLCNFKDAVDIWRMRGATYMLFFKGAENIKELSDSALYCLRMAYRLLPKMSDEMRPKHIDHCNFDKASLFIENEDIFADSLNVAINLLKTTDDTYSTLSISKKILLGRGYVLTGRHNEGIELINAGLAEYRKQNWKEGVEWALQILAKSYAETGHGAQLAAIYPELKATEDDIMNQTKINTLVGADFKYRLRDKERQVNALKERNVRSEKIIILGAAVLLLGLLGGVFLTITYIQLKSKSRREKELHEKEISDILSKQVTLNNRIEQLNEQLKRKEHDDVIDKVVEQINPTLLAGDDETKFRRAFMSLHPHFLKKLRQNYPGLTSGDELICMLIYLKVPTIDMAASLGISRPSLNSARYRLRKRLNLDKDTDLDAFILAQ